LAANNARQARPIANVNFPVRPSNHIPDLVREIASSQGISLRVLRPEMIYVVCTQCNHSIMQRIGYMQVR